eukprot:GGOE01001967.1.p1 GENE.GGOE01001967.1~~GGOE01001967.1.p1  ORF type:complete len:487 (+),score=104.55 GGOE01001967.1:72-1463(+)
MADLQRLIAEVLQILEDLQREEEAHGTAVPSRDTAAKRHADFQATFGTSGLPVAEATNHHHGEDARLSTICSRHKFSDPSVDIHTVDWASIVGLATPGATGDSEAITVPSGGQVFVVRLQGGLCILKFTRVRGESYSELLATDLGRALGVTTPAMRLLHANSNEWRALRCGIGALRSDRELVGNALALMEACHCCLVAEFVAGEGLDRVWHDAEEDVILHDSRCIEQLGRVLVLDLATHNPDRLPCAPLGWKGNLSNIRVNADQRAVIAIDSGIPHLPARLRDKIAHEDRAAIEELLSLLQSDLGGFAQLVFQGVASPLDFPFIAQHLARGVAEAVDKVRRVLPALREARQILCKELDEFLSFTHGDGAPRNANFGVTKQVKDFQKARPGSVDTHCEALLLWNERFAEVGCRIRHSLEIGCVLRTGFLDDNIAVHHALSNAYELKVRLDTVVDRMEWLATAQV